MGMYLDGESTLLEENLRFVKNDLEEELNEIMGGKSSLIPERPYKLVKPVPGFCLKAFKAIDNDKFFINVCQTDGIPPPRDITELELADILKSPEASSYRVPMSISELRKTADKSGKDATVCDVAIHPDFFKKIQSSNMFHVFFVTVIFEAIEQKYDIQMNETEYVILKNRKSMGNLITHRVENRDIAKVEESHRKSNLIQELDDKKLQQLLADKCNLQRTSNNLSGGDSSSDSQYVPNPTKQAIAKAATKQPQYRLIAMPHGGDVSHLIAEFYLPDVISVNEIGLDINSDRIVLEVRKRGYMLDVFVDYVIDERNSKADFNSFKGVLTLFLPIIGK